MLLCVHRCTTRSAQNLPFVTVSMKVLEGCIPRVLTTHECRIGRMSCQSIHDARITTISTAARIDNEVTVFTGSQVVAHTRVFALFHPLAYFGCFCYTGRGGEQCSYGHFWAHSLKWPPSSSGSSFFSARMSRVNCNSKRGGGALASSNCAKCVTRPPRLFQQSLQAFFFLHCVGEADQDRTAFTITRCQARRQRCDKTVGSGPCLFGFSSGRPLFPPWPSD